MLKAEVWWGPGCIVERGVPERCSLMLFTRYLSGFEESCSRWLGLLGMGGLGLVELLQAADSLATLKVFIS